MSVYRNIVQWRCDDSGPVLALQLESDLELIPGIKPCLFRAIVPYTEFDKLSGDMSKKGRLEFWFHHAPDDTTPDYFLRDVSIVDVEVSKYGELIAGGGRRIIEYRLHLADGRQRFVEPFGGIVAAGELNKTPFNPSSGVDANGKTLRTNMELVSILLDAMGMLSSISVPSTLNSFPAVRDVEWRGNHAPTELERILEQCDHVFYVRMDGTFKIEQIGSGSTPEFTGTGGVPTELQLVDQDLPRIDRRGKTVIIDSAPRAIVDTRELSGPSATTFVFVAQDADNSWKPLESLTIIGSKTPVQIVQNWFLDIDEKYRQRATDQFYRFVRLVGAADGGFGEGKALRQVYLGNTAPTAITAKAMQIRGIGGGMYANTADYCPVTVDAMFEGSRVHFAERMGRLASGVGATNDPFAKFAAPAEGDVRLTITSQVVDTVSLPGGTGGATVSVLRFYMAGFQWVSGAAVQLDDTALASAIGGRDRVLWRHHPELQLYRVNGVDQNKTDLDAAAMLLAKKLLAGSGQAPKLYSAKGFWQAQLSGVINKVRVSQSRVITEAWAMTWYQPSDGMRIVRAEMAGNLGWAAATPKQLTTAGGQAAAGVGSVVQPGAMLGAGAPSGPTAPAMPGVSVKITAAGSYGGVYAGEMLQAPATQPSSGNLADTNVGTLPSATDCWVHNLAEVGAATHAITIGSDLVGRIAGSDAAGKPIVHVWWVAAGSGGSGGGTFAVTKQWRRHYHADGDYPWTLDTGDWRHVSYVATMRAGPTVQTTYDGFASSPSAASRFSNIEVGSTGRVGISVPVAQASCRGSDGFDIYGVVYVDGSDGSLKLIGYQSSPGTVRDAYFDVAVAIVGTASNNAGDYAD